MMNQTNEMPEMIEVSKETYHELLKEWAADTEENKLGEPWTHVRFYYQEEDEAIVYGHDENVGTWTDTDGAQGVSIGDHTEFTNQKDWFDFVETVREMESDE